MTTPLRVVVATDGPVVSAAAARAVDRLVEVSSENLSVRVRPGVGQPRRGGGTTSVTDVVQRAFYRPRFDASARVDLRESRWHLVEQSTTPVGAGADVVLDLTTGGLPSDEAGTPRLGVWSLRFGSDRRRLGSRAFEQEYLEGRDVGRCELVAELAPGATGHLRVLYRSVSGVDPLWPGRAGNEAAWKAAEFPARALVAVLSDRVVADALPCPDLPESPDPGHAAPLMPTMVRRGLREAARRLVRRPSWFVAVRTGDGAATPADRDFDATGFQMIDAPPGRFYADPFVVGRREGGAYVFVEDGSLEGGPARISVLTLDPNGVPLGPARPVLERTTHLSYPFVFEEAGSWYMLPETAATGAIELLRAREFPWRWEPCQILVPDVLAWDPTLLRHAGRYWLFAAVAAPGGRPSDELCLYSAPALLGPWGPHPRNPVVSDVRRARPAGRVLESNGTLVRPAQDGAGAYGRRIVLNRIDVLTTEDYQETAVGSLEPGWLPGVVRTHTYTTDGGVEALDGVRHSRRFRPRGGTRTLSGTRVGHGRPMPR